MSLKLDIASATRELQEKTFEVIQQETAEKWASRSVAAFLRSSSSTKLDLKITWYARGEDYYSEAVEHAAFASAKLIDEVKAVLKPHRTKAVDEIKKWKNV